MSRFERKLTNFNIAAIGYRNSNVPALGIVIANTLNSLMGTGEEYAADNKACMEKEELAGICFSAVSVNYETDCRHYVHKDYLNAADCAKGLIRDRADGAILVVNGPDGITSEITEELHLARTLGIDYLSVFVDNCDLIDDEAQLEQLGDEIRGLLDENEYCSEDTPITYGSARGALEDPDSEWGQSILEMFEYIDDGMPDPENDRDKPFVLSVEDVFTITGRGTVVTGRVETGVIKVGDRVEVAGFGADNRTVAVTGIEMFRKLLDAAEAGDNVGLLLRGIDRSELRRGHVITRKGGCESSSECTAVVHLAAPMVDEAFKFRFRTAEVGGTFSVERMMREGQCAEVSVRLSEQTAMNPGLFFAIRDNDDKPVGVGRIVDVL